ncbi:MAG: septum formation initiator family protein [Bacteriovoracales bacterium]|nr:septum formation initiator family protein [Bacteriovoracales bacterium]
MDFYRKDSQIASDRLRKAIERNRRKQLQKKELFRDQSQGPRASVRLRPASGVRRTLTKTGPSLPFRKPRLGGGLDRTMPPPPSPPLSRSQTFGGKWYQKILFYTGWAFCFVLLGRLIFADRGVIDYYSKEALIKRKVHQNDLIQRENQKLLKEIELMDKDAAYQKKMVRKHLEVIAKDEYLILFAREKSSF